MFFSFQKKHFSLIYYCDKNFYSVPGMVLGKHGAGETKTNKGHGPQPQGHGREVRPDLYTEK